MEKDCILGHCPFENRLVDFVPGPGGYRRCGQAHECGQHASERMLGRERPGDLIMLSTRVATRWGAMGGREVVTACNCARSMVGNRWQFASLNGEMS